MIKSYLILAFVSSLALTSCSSIDKPNQQTMDILLLVSQFNQVRQDYNEVIATIDMSKIEDKEDEDMLKSAIYDIDAILNIAKNDHSIHRYINNAAEFNKLYSDALVSLEWAQTYYKSIRNDLPIIKRKQYDRLSRSMDSLISSFEKLDQTDNITKFEQWLQITQLALPMIKTVASMLETP